MTPWMLGAGGSLALALGALLVWGERAGLAGRWPWFARLVGGTSLPTRLMAGVGLLVAGYHLVAWGFPRLGLAELVGMERWWWLALGVGASVAGSMALDRYESGDARAGM